MIWRHDKCGGRLGAKIVGMVKRWSLMREKKDGGGRRSMVRWRKGSFKTNSEETGSCSSAVGEKVHLFLFTRLFTVIRSWFFEVPQRCSDLVLFWTLRFPSCWGFSLTLVNYFSLILTRQSHDECSLLSTVALRGSSRRFEDEERQRTNRWRMRSWMSAKDFWTI